MKEDEEGWVNWGAGEFIYRGLCLVVVWRRGTDGVRPLRGLQARGAGMVAYHTWVQVLFFLHPLLSSSLPLVIGNFGHMIDIIFQHACPHCQ